MQFFLILATAFALVALSQQQESSVDATTLPPPKDEDQPQNPIRKPFVYLFPQGFDSIIVPELPDANEEIEQVQGPFEYHFNDRFSVEPYLTFPPNVGGGLTFRYRF